MEYPLVLFLSSPRQEKGPEIHGSRPAQLYAETLNIIHNAKGLTIIHIFGEGISMALGYGKVAAGELAEAFSTGDFSFSGYKHRLARSALGQTLFVRWAITNILYRLRWAWFQRWFWRSWKPIILAFSWVFVLNWGKRLKS